MERRSLGESFPVQDDLIRKACSLAFAAHTSLSSAFLIEKPLNSNHVIFAFPASSSIDNWYARKSFGECQINRTLFPSIRNIGSAETGLVNESFLQQFETLLTTSSLQQEVSRGFTENRQTVFTGHSSGAPTAILATIWLLERLKQENYDQHHPLCITFGSPLIGDRVLGHALQRQRWSNHFLHLVARHDIVPRILFAPLSSIEKQLPTILGVFDPNSSNRHDSVARSEDASVFFGTVIRNASYVASHAACLFMGCTTSLLETINSFVKLSPYRPFGTYIFCTGKRKFVAVTNSQVVLQLLFYSIQYRPEQDIKEVTYRSLQEHKAYGLELQESLLTHDVVYLDNIQQLPLSTDRAQNDQTRLIDAALNDLGLSERARICLRAAREVEKQQCRNQSKIDSNMSKIEESLNMLEGYRATCEVRELGYYDAFKFQREIDDFNANVKRLELAGMWDEIVDMLSGYELPDGFESRKEWVNVGTKYRRLVEPLDIANYYRHSKNDDTGPYMIKGRPWRYRLIQRWLEHDRNMTADSCLESCFWAEVEELCCDAGSGKVFEEVKDRVLGLEREVLRWANCAAIAGDVFLEESSFVKWWKTLPCQHKAGSCIAALMNGEGKNLPTLSYT